MFHRCRKFVRRNRALVTGAAAVFAAILLGIAGIATFAYREQRQARTAQAIVDFLNRDLLGSVSPDQAGSPQVTVHSILDTASARLEGKFHDEPLVEASIRQTLGQMYIELGDYRLAEPHLRRAYETRRRQLGDKAPLTLTSMSVLGRVCYLQGRFAEAEPLLAQALESRRLVLGPEHRDTLESSVWLAINYLYPGEADHMDEAERLLTSALESSRRAGGKKDATTLEAMYGLAFLRGMIWGRIDEAAALCLEGCQAAQLELGERHRLTLQFTTMSAWILTSPDLYEEVQARVRTALETNQQILGKEHPDTLIAMSTLGMVYARQNELEKAESLLTESLPLLRKSVGEGHGYTVFFTRYLGRLYLSQGRYKEAEQLFTKLIDDGRPSLGNDHLLLLTTRFFMIQLYAMQERPDDLKAWCSRELEQVRRTPGDTGLAAAHILCGLAWVEATYTSSAVRNGAEAIKHATEACELTDWKCSTMIDTLAAAYAETGDFASAVRWQKKAIEVFAQEPHPWMLDLSAAAYRLRLYESGRPARLGLWLGDPHTLLGRKKYEEAEREWTNELAVIRRYLGESHPETRGCILALIELYEDWGKPQEAQRYREMLPREESPDPGHK